MFRNYSNINCLNSTITQFHLCKHEILEGEQQRKPALIYIERLRSHIGQ